MVTNNFNPAAEKELYFDILPLLLDELERRYNIPAVDGVLTSRIAEFLSKRNLDHEANLEELVRTNTSEAVTIGQTYHFTRKTTLKNYEFRDPIPLIDATFDALEFSSNEYTSKFFRTVCELMTGDKKTQPNISFVLSRVLPHVASEYGVALKSVEAVAKDNHKYQKAKTALEQGYVKLLDGVLDYTKAIILNHRTASMDDFNEYRRSKNLLGVLIPK